MSASKFRVWLCHPGYNFGGGGDSGGSENSATIAQGKLLDYNLGKLQETDTMRQPLMAPGLTGAMGAYDKFSDKGYIEGRVGQANIDAQNAIGQNTAAMGRNMARYGLNPASGRFAGMANQNAIGNAALQAGAVNTTRTGLADQQTTAAVNKWKLLNDMQTDSMNQGNQIAGGYGAQGSAMAQNAQNANAIQSANMGAVGQLAGTAAGLKLAGAFKDGGRVGYAKGGMVSRAFAWMKGDSDKPEGDKPANAKIDNLGDGKAAQAADALKQRKNKIDEELRRQLGYANGGRVGYALGGRADMMNRGMGNMQIAPSTPQAPSPTNAVVDAAGAGAQAYKVGKAYQTAQAANASQAGMLAAQESGMGLGTAVGSSLAPETVAALAANTGATAAGTAAGTAASTGLSTAAATNAWNPIGWALGGLALFGALNRADGGPIDDAELGPAEDRAAMFAAVFPGEKYAGSPDQNAKMITFLRGIAAEQDVDGTAGGKVDGPGTKTSDSVPANLSRGEYVVNADAVELPGVLPALDAINQEGLKKRQNMASGGLAGFVDGLGDGLTTGYSMGSHYLDQKSKAKLKTDLQSAFDAHPDLSQEEVGRSEAFNDYNTKIANEDADTFGVKYDPAGYAHGNAPKTQTDATVARNMSIAKALAAAGDVRGAMDVQRAAELARVQARDSVRQDRRDALAEGQVGLGMQKDKLSIQKLMGEQDQVEKTKAFDAEVAQMYVAGAKPDSKAFLGLAAKHGVPSEYAANAYLKQVGVNKQDALNLVEEKLTTLNEAAMKGLPALLELADPYPNDGNNPQLVKNKDGSLTLMYAGKPMQGFEKLPAYNTAAFIYKQIEGIYKGNPFAAAAVLADQEMNKLKRDEVRSKIGENQAKAAASYASAGETNAELDYIKKHGVKIGTASGSAGKDYATSVGDFAITRTNKETGAIDVIDPRSGGIVASIPGPGQSPAPAGKGPKINEIRTINGKKAQWDGRGWKVVK